MVETRTTKKWTDHKHEPAKRTNVHNLIRGMLEKELKIPAAPHKPIINLGLGKRRVLVMCVGEPTKANGYDIPAVINEAIIEQVQKETVNGYTAPSGMIEARKAIVEK